MVSTRRMCAVIVVCLLAGSSALAADRPNIVWLVSEDNSVHYLKLFDEHGAPTPHIAKMAEHGLLFTHAFSNAPVCSVARTTLATGCYAPRIGTQYHRKLVPVPMPDGLQMFSRYLRDAGYYATNNSKTDYNVISDKNVWDESSRKATWRNRTEDQPFFHMQSFATTHESSLHFPQRVMDTEKTSTDPSTVFVAPYHPDTPTFRYTNARYRDRIMQVDQQIGRVIDQLRQDELLEDTFVFYFGDHGGVLPRGKGYACESGLHVPLVVRIPNNWRHLVDAKPGSRQKGFVSFVDFGPTALHLAGVPIPSQMDGQPFLGKGITQQDLDARDESFGYADRFDEKYDLVRTLRKGRYEYIRNYQPFNFDGLQNNYRYRMLAFAEWRELYAAGKLNEVQRQFFERRPAEQLFDVENDPHEINNLATDPAYREVLQDLRMRLAARVKSMPDLSFFPESHLIEAAFDNPVQFGQQHKPEIAELVDIADLALLPYAEARQRMESLLQTPNVMKCYWALIACSSFGTEAQEMAPLAKNLTGTATPALVSIRAAEFLGLIGHSKPQPVFDHALRNTASGAEAGLILNSLVLLKDGKPGYDFEVSADMFQNSVRNNDVVKRRLEYLVP